MRVSAPEPKVPLYSVSQSSFSGGPCTHSPCGGPLSWYLSQQQADWFSTLHWVAPHATSKPPPLDELELELARELDDDTLELREDDGLGPGPLGDPPSLVEAPTSELVLDAVIAPAPPSPFS